MSLLDSPAWPFTYPRSPDFQIRVDGRPVDVLGTPAAAVATWTALGAVTVEIITRHPITKAYLRPQSRKIPMELCGVRVCFRLSGPGHYCFETPGSPSLFLHAYDQPETAPKDLGGGIRTFEQGRIHPVGEIKLQAYETLYIPEGTIVESTVLAVQAPGVRLCGRGALCGTGLRESQGRTRMILLEHCPGTQVEDMLVIDPCGWTVSLAQCDDSFVRGLRVLGKVVGGDGIDIVGSSRVTVEDCCLRNNDDCVVIKSVNLHRQSLVRPSAGEAPVEDVCIRRCVLWNDHAGNAIEIGHELMGPYIRRIQIEDCDILCCHGHGAPISINNCGPAIVSNVVFENIRIEHFYDALFAIRITRSQFKVGDHPGWIRDITLRNLEIHVSKDNPGYSFSYIGGYDAEHRVENIHFENIRLSGQRAHGVNDLDLYFKHVLNVTVS